MAKAADGESGDMDYIGQLGKLKDFAGATLTAASFKAYKIIAGALGDLSLSDEDTIKLVTESREIYIACQTMGIDPKEYVKLDLSDFVSGDGAAFTDILGIEAQAPERRQLTGGRNKPATGEDAYRRWDGSGNTVRFGTLIGNDWGVRKHPEKRAYINTVVKEGSDEVFTKYLMRGQRTGFVVREGNVEAVKKRITEIASDDTTEPGPPGSPEAQSDEVITYSTVLVRMNEYQTDGKKFLDAAKGYAESDRTLKGILSSGQRKDSYKLSVDDRGKVVNRVRKLYRGGRSASRKKTPSSGTDLVPLSEAVGNARCILKHYQTAGKGGGLMPAVWDAFDRDEAATDFVCKRESDKRSKQFVKKKDVSKLRSYVEENIMPEVLEKLSRGDKKQQKKHDKHEQKSNAANEANADISTVLAVQDRPLGTENDESKHLGIDTDEVLGLVEIQQQFGIPVQDMQEYCDRTEFDDILVPTDIGDGLGKGYTAGAIVELQKRLKEKAEQEEHVN